jgi:hypothetical protein
VPAAPEDPERNVITVLPQFIGLLRERRFEETAQPRREVVKLPG